MIISELNKADYAGRSFTMKYTASGYYDIEKNNHSFLFSYHPFDMEKEMMFEDRFFNDWLEAPVAFGAFEDKQLIGYVEGSLEQWNNRYRISNICIFSDIHRHQGIGTQLMQKILQEAVQSGARMAVLETQSCNEKAIAFYQKHGFEIIGFDLYAYTNEDIERHEIRIEMGKKLK